MEHTVIDQNMAEGKMTITPQIKTFLKETAKWGKFLAIVGFIMIGFFVVFAIFAGTIMSGVLSEMSGPSAVSGGMITVIYLLLGLIYFFPVLYLYRFSVKMQTALKNDDQEFLASSFENLKSCYKFMGIFMAVVLGFYGIVLVGGLLFGGIAAFM